MTPWMPRRKLGVATSLVAALAFAPAQARALSPEPSAQQVRQAVDAHRLAQGASIVGELRTLLSLPNVASDRAGIQKNAQHLEKLLRRRGFAVQRLEDGTHPPVVYGELSASGARSTVVFYAHYDGQPVEPSRWDTPPFEPALVSGRRGEGTPLPWSALEREIQPDWRVYGRSSSDDKAPIVALLAALDALKAANLSPSVNVKLFFEGEEEAGSPHLHRHLRRHRALLSADAWIFCDGPVHPSGRRQVVFGVRGIVGLQLTVFGPSRVLHSGHYGNWAPNPAAQLTQLLASMRDAEGAVTIDGFLDEVEALSAAERTAVRNAPSVEAALRRDLLIGRSEGYPARLLARIMRPALNIDGLAAGRTGAKAKNAIPNRAEAALDFRLVPRQTPAHIRRVIEAHIRAQGFRIVYRDPPAKLRRNAAKMVKLTWDEGYPAVRTPMNHPISRAVTKIVDAAVPEEVVRVPMLGGSLPLYRFEQTFGVPLIIVPTVNHDNNQHAPNENLRLGHFFDSIAIYAALVARLGHAL